MCTRYENGRSWSVAYNCHRSKCPVIDRRTNSSILISIDLYYYIKILNLYFIIIDIDQPLWLGEMRMYLSSIKFLLVSNYKTD